MSAEQRKRTRLEQALQRDIIDLKRADEAVRESEARYRLISDSAQNSIFSYDRNGRFTFANRHLCEVLRLSADQIVGKTHAELGFPEAQCQEWDALHRKVYETGATVVALTSTPLPDGRLHYFEVTLAPLHDQSGTIIGISGVDRDITERTLAETERRRSEERYHILFQHMLNAFAYHKMIFEQGQPKDYIFLDVNDAFETMTGLKNIIGKRVSEVIPGIYDTDRELLETYGRVALTGQSEKFETYVEALNMWVSISVYSPEREDFVTIFDVISERKQAEARIRRLNRTLSVLSDVNQAIVRIHSLLALFETACQIAVEKGGFRMAWVGLYDAETRTVKPVASAGVVGDYLDKINITLDDEARARGPVATAVRTNQPVVFTDIEHNPAMSPWREAALALGYRTISAFPLTVGGEVRGVFTLYSSEVDFLDDEELRLLVEMASDLSFAMEFAEQEAQRRQAEEALRAREEQYRSLVESSDATICTFDGDGVLLYANQITADTLRMPLTQIVGKPMHALFPPAVADAQLNVLRRVMQTEKGIVNETRSSILGAERWFRNSIQPVRDGAGRVSAVLINAADITAFKQAEADLQKAHDTLELKVVERTAELQAAKEQVEAILNNSLDGILLVDADLRIRQTNDAFKKLVGCAAEACSDASLLDFINANDRDRVKQAVQASILRQSGTHIEAAAQQADGTRFDAEMSIGLINADGLVCTLRDITERKQSEQDLRASEERYRQMFEHNMAIKLVLDRQTGAIVDANPAACTFYGYSLETLKTMHVSEINILSPEEIAAQMNLASAQTRNVFEFRHRLASGEIRDVEVYSGPVEIQGRPLLYSIIMDITDRKRAERDLRESEARYRLLADNATDVVMRYDKENRYSYVSPSSLAVLGYEPDQLLGHRVLDYTHPDDVPGILEQVKGQLEHPGHLTISYRFRHKDGHYVWLEVNGKTVVSETTGKALAFVGSARDLTDRRTMEEALRESEERFRQIAENIDHILFIRSGDDRDILYINPAYEALTGRTREALYARPGTFMEVVHPDDKDYIRYHLGTQRYIEEGLADFEYRILAADQQVHWMRVRIFPIRDKAGVIIRRAGIIEDVTQQKQYEEALESALRHERELSELKSRFVSMASHEFRTPLASILSSTELLMHFRQKMDDDKIRQKLMAITAQVRHLTSVIEDVLQLTRIQSQRVEYNPVELNPDELCREIVEEFQTRTDVSQRLIYSAETVVPMMELDRRLMRQIISNLLSNAIKYSPKGAKVTVSLEYGEKTLILTVSDEGIGIPENDLKHLFEPFHRAANVGAVSGTGLGLSITKESIELHGGTIAVESEVNVGTVITVRIPSSPPRGEG